ncbi:hypothetical protein HanPSC8_Chr06g0263591 [Helianthus annuus]|nr:hypothetical protein HanPSC8_Chr06g0263591 [Helianthus annuus]
MCILFYKCRINKTCFGFTDFLEKQTEFPFFLDAPTTQVVVIFQKFNQFATRYMYIINLYQHDNKQF